MNQHSESTLPPAPPPRRPPSPLRVAVFTLLFVVTVGALVLNALLGARARENTVQTRIESYYYAFMGDFLARVTLGMESLERKGTALLRGSSPDELAEAAAENYELALQRREEDLGLRIALATMHWHAALLADQQAAAARQAGRLGEAQESDLRAGQARTDAVMALQGGLSLYPADRTITTLVYGVSVPARVQRAWLDDPELRRIAARIAPGHLLMSMLYEDAGMPQRARAELERGHAVGWRAVLKVSVAVTLFAVGMLLGVVIWLLVLLGRTRLRARRIGPARAPWSIWRAVELCILWLFLSMVFGLARAELASGTEVTSLPWVLGVLAAYAGAGGVAIAWFALSAGPEGVPVRALGWRRVPILKALGGGIAGYLATLPIVYPVLAVVNHFIESPAPSSPVVAVMMSASGTAARVALIGLVVVAAPLVEETIFRGVLYTGLRRRLRFRWAAGLSAVVFAGAHMQAVAFLPIAILGMILAYVYERTGSLWASAITHAAFNAASVAAIYLLMS